MLNFNKKATKKVIGVSICYVFLFGVYALIEVILPKKNFSDIGWLTFIIVCSAICYLSNKVNDWLYQGEETDKGKEFEKTLLTD